jgi:hypothetical protein
MSLLTVYLVDDAALSDEMRDGIRARMDTLFKEVLQRAPALSVSTGGIDGVAVRWVQSCPQGRTPWDVVINFQTGGRGTYCREPDYQSRRPGGYHVVGHTGSAPQGARSVVYVPHCDPGISLPPAFIGSVAFHEFLHNKLHTGRGLHSRRHMHHAMTLHHVGPATPLNNDEVRLLAPHLGDAVPQACP